MRLHHGGRIVRTRDDSLEFLDMCEELLIFSETPSLTQLVERVKVKLGWNEGDVHVQFEGVIDVGSSKGPRIKRLLKITNESEWNDYKAVVLASEVRSLDLVVSKESGLGNDNFEAWPSSPAHIGYGPLSEEEILVTQLGYGGGEVFGSLERDGGWLRAVEMRRRMRLPMVRAIMIVMKRMMIM